MKEVRPTGWGTKRELEWIKNIGEESQHTKSMDKVVLLEGYLEGAKKRKRWDDLDKSACIKLAKSILAKLLEERNAR